MTYAPFNVDWLANFWRWENLIDLLEFYIALSEMLLTISANQEFNNLNLIKLWLACAKQNAVVKVTSDACSMLAI